MTNLKFNPHRIGENVMKIQAKSIYHHFIRMSLCLSDIVILSCGCKGKNLNWNYTNQNKDNEMLKALRNIALVIGGVVGGWIAYSRTQIKHDLPLPKAIDTNQETYTGRLTSRRISYYADTEGAGKPLVLVHSINAAGSAYEVKPIFEHYRGQRPVYALELPGFGFSERSDTEYSWRLYTDSIIEFLADIVGEPADVIALSLGSEFVARAAHEQPHLFRSVAMISPSGFTERENKVASQRASDEGNSNGVYNVFANPLWSQAFYDLLATRVSIKYFLEQSFEGEPDVGLMDYGFITCHQPGARFAPLYFVSGQLFTPDIREAVYEHLTIPTLVIYDQDNFVSFDTLPDVVNRYDNWQAERITPTKGLPHFEKLSEVATTLDRFWSNL